MPVGNTKGAPSRIVIQYPAPSVDGGRYPVKRVVGDVVRVSADVFRDGHEILRAVVRYRAPGSRRWVESPMRPVDAHVNGVRWEGEFGVETMGRWQWTVEAWSDVFATWRDELQRKVGAGQEDLAGELSEGVVLLEDAAGRAKGPDRKVIEQALADLREEPSPDTGLAPDLFEAMERASERTGATTLAEPLAVEVDRVPAAFASWYELFPRSWGGLQAVEKQIPAIAELGFDVLYFPPIHPIGRTARKGRNNSLTAGPDDPGSPYAIGSEEGGHDAVHPELGTMDDVRALCATAREHGMDVALDLALNSSPDHPWLQAHPEWFQQRPDGTLKYAENPPKRYQDIYNFNWDTPAWRELWQAWRDVVLTWVDAGVKFFRVDNPHTKPFPFWAWLIKEVHAVDRTVVFLAEAFTRRAVMRHLAKIGFTQSYTYFTWKNSRWELSEYVNELALGPEREYFRPNFFINTPDILHAYLQHGGPPAFHSRLVLAATLSPTYGIYSGYEHFENVPVREGSEEYLDSEKYEIKPRALDGPLLPTIRRVNEIRRENPALRRLENVTFLDTHNEALIGYVKSVPGNTIVCIVNIDPDWAQEGAGVIPAHLGLPPAFHSGLVLAGTLSPSYGIYSGYEHFENLPVREGSEEYLDSEKYETKQRALDGPLLPTIRRVNEIRRENPALRRLENLTFLETHNEALIGYVKSVPGNTVVCVVNIDPHNAQEGAGVIPAHVGLPPAFAVHDLLSGAHFDWRIGANYVRLDPGAAHVLRVEA